MISQKLSALPYIADTWNFVFERQQVQMTVLLALIAWKKIIF